MRDWFADAFGSAVSDVRAKLIDEAWFDRRVPEQSRRDDLGWSLDHPGVSEPAPQSPEPDRGIDR